MAKRKSNNEGTIYETSYGTFRAQVSVNGKRLSYTGKSKKECQTWIRNTLSKIDTGLTYDAAQTTYREFLKNWLVSVKASIKLGTWKQYNQLVRDYIVPVLGSLKLIDLRPDHIQRLYDRKLAEGKGPRTVQLIHAVIRRSLNHALRLGIIGRNPALATFPPKIPPKEMKIYDEEQVQRLIAIGYLTGNLYTQLFQLAIATGMRMGELIGLQWKDIDWSRQTIHIRRQYNRNGRHEAQFSPPKTKRGIRKIEVGPQVMAVLETQSKKVSQMVIENQEKWSDLDLVFPSKNGSPINGRYLLTCLKRLAKEADLPPIRFHDLRHTAASLMLNSGIPVLTVSHRLGHAKPSITLDVYGHLIASMQGQVATLMDQYIAPLEVSTAVKTAPQLHRNADIGNNG